MSGQQLNDDDDIEGTEKLKVCKSTNDIVKALSLKLTILIDTFLHNGCVLFNTY